MTKARLVDVIKTAPRIYDADAAVHFLDALTPSLGDCPKNIRDLIGAIGGASPYLRRLAERQKADLAAFFEQPLQTSLNAASALARSAVDADGEAAQSRQLRQAKAKAALAIAIADLGGALDVMAAAKALSDFADQAIEGALAAGFAKAKLPPGAGVAIIAMGKLGARELNYSSDIDLIVIFDRARMGDFSPADAQSRAVAVTRAMVNFLHQQTADGYVFRTDLRLRPDPGATAVAISAASAETYYETYGQNWERMAFIKARACAGDIELGEQFLAALRPFVWRKYLDFAAIEDVHAVKRQIHSAKGGGAIEFEGQDVKLGRGGIREIEFYVQTQQLILGGKNPELRARETLAALDALAHANAITHDAAQSLSAHYRYLRHIEHRIQMINDEQTHRLPRAQSDIERLAAFSGEPGADAFKGRMVQTMRAVKHHYDALFVSDTVDLQRQYGPMVFTGVEADPATLDTLAGMGFARAGDVSAAIRRWHAGGLRATRTERARVLLTKLVPLLLESLSKATSPDDAFFAFEKFLAQLPSGVQVFSLLLNNPAIFDSLIRIMTLSPYLGKELSKHLNLVESLLENRFATAAHSGEPRALAAQLAGAQDYEQQLNLARRWASEARFETAAALALGALPADAAAARFTAIAEDVILELAPCAMREIERVHGRMGGRLAIMALGRLGAREMTSASDLDLMFVYDAPDDAQSDGARPLGPVDYYTRLVRRIVTALSAATEEGGLYDVDMQLRPSGGAGPAAVRLSAFKRYYSDEAWTWELMALARARIIGGDATLADELMRERDAIFRRPRDPVHLARDVADMRAKLQSAHPAKTLWDVKRAAGGMTDISFICQYLALAGGAAYGAPPPMTRAAISSLAAAGALSRENAASLSSAYDLFEKILQTSRAIAGGSFDPAAAGEAAEARMAYACEESVVSTAAAKISSIQTSIHSIFHAIVVSVADGRMAAERE